MTLPKDVPLPELIASTKAQALENFMSVVIESLEDSGFSLGDVLKALAAYCESQGLSKAQSRLEEAYTDVSSV